MVFFYRLVTNYFPLKDQSNFKITIHYDDMEHKEKRLHNRKNVVYNKSLHGNIKQVFDDVSLLILAQLSTFAHLENGSLSALLIRIYNTTQILGNRAKHPRWMAMLLQDFLRR